MVVCICLPPFFPDDDMARSDSRMREESKRIQAKCLMEIHVKSFVWSKCFSFCFSMDVSGLDIPDLRYMSILLELYS